VAGDFDLPDRIPLGDFNVCVLAGPIVATGRPRLVTVTVVPFSSISSNKARHLALNSVAPMTRVFMNSSYPVQYSHLTGLNPGPRSTLPGSAWVIFPPSI